MTEEKFPYKSMPIRLDINSKKLTTQLCFFYDIVHAEKYIDRYKLTKKEYKISQPRKKSK